MSGEGGGRGRPAPGDIAIVGMACLFPGAPDLDAYWNNIVSKTDCITDPPPEAWEAEIFYAPDSDANDRVYCKRGGFIGPLAWFDPLAHGVMPRAVEGGEPDQWLALQVARDALTDAGYGEEIPERQRAAVILGKGTYLNRGNVSVVQHGRVVDQTLEILKTLHPEIGPEDLEVLRRDLKAELPPFNADTAPSLIPNMVSGRIANRLDLMGPNYTVDAACASSLVALEHAVRGLAAREYDLALVGGVHVATPVPTLMLFCQLGALSRQQRIRPFDRSADGTLLGGGVGMIVLKRREDAERDGQRIYALVKGVGVASDGRGLGVTAPRLEGEVLALERAYRAAGVDPRSVELIEAHGTGTPVGDVTEVQALSQVFGPRGEAPPHCALGSVKSMISHLMPAAGIAGIIKVALALHHKVLPPTLGVEEPNPRLGLPETTFYLNTETRPWIHGRDDAPRRAGVNAFGFGGINAHALLEEHPAEDAAGPGHPQRWDSEVCILTAASRPDLMERARELLAFVERRPEAALADLAFTLNAPLASGPLRLAVVASDPKDLKAKLGRALERLSDPACRRIQEVQGIYFSEAPLAAAGQVAFMFPGEGSQYVHMLSDLCPHFPEVRRCFDLMDRIFAGHARNYVPSDYLFPRPSFTAAEPAAAQERLWQMEGAFEAVLAANGALLAVMRRLEVRPDCVVGHSTGEYSAMLAAGMIDLADEARAARFATELNRFYYEERARQGIPRAVLLAVGAGVERVSAVVGRLPGVEVAMDNCPHQTVVVGGEEEMARCQEELERDGVICERLPFDRPYHTPRFEGCAGRLASFLTDWIDAPPRVKTWSCTSVAPFPEELGEARELAVRHWMRPVEFRRTIEAMHEAGVRIFVEVGPRGNLSAFVGDTLRSRPHLALPLNVAGRSGIAQLNHAVGLLAAHGVPLRLEGLYDRRASRELDLRSAEPKPKARRIKLETDWIPMRLSEEVASRLRSAQPAATPLPAPEPAVVAAGHRSEDADGVVAAHLRTMEQFLDVQREVMEAFLSGRGGDRAAVERLPAAEVVAPAAEPPREEKEAASPEPPLAEPVSAQPASTVRERLLRIVGDRTGYPPEMLGLDLDLEADLGIDSIKRVEILGTLQREVGLGPDHDMEALSRRRTLREVIEFLEGAGAVAAPQAETPPLPFVGTVVSLVPGREMVARREVRLEEDLYLRDHTLGRRVSFSDPDLTGLPVMPLTMTMEILAEAAAVLMPGRRLTAMRDVRGHRWLALDGERIVLELAARARSENEVVARIFEVDEASAGRGEPVAEGTLVFGDARPEAPAAEPLSLRAERPSRWTPERLYQEVMFHGPAFRGVASVDRWGEDGAEATLLARPSSGLFASHPRPALVTDPVLLDQPGQVVGFWTAEHLETGYVVFPFHLDALELFDPAPAAGERVRCLARIALVGEQQVRSDLEVVGSEGRVRARLRGWKDVRFDLPREFLRFLHDPGEGMVTTPWPVSPAGREFGAGLTACRLSLDGFPAGFFTAHGGIWRRALAHLVLGRREREHWRSLTAPEPRRLEWLLGRVAAKDALRRHLRAHHGLSLRPADIEILPDEHGRPTAQGGWVADLAGVPLLSISHSDGVAVAVVADAAVARGLGVDVERLGRATEEPARMTFSAGERALLSSVADAEAEGWLLRLWCAKEAVAKSLGRGRSDGPRSLVVEDLDREAGTVRVGSDGQAPGSRGTGGGWVAHTTREGDLIVATAVASGSRQGNEEGREG